MTIVERFIVLRAKPMSTEIKERFDLEFVERALGSRLPDGLRILLLKFVDPIIFDADVSFRPAERSRWEDTNGLLSLEILYGLTDDDWSLIKMNDTYRGRIPSEFIAIGDAGGGNQICLDTATGRVLFWDHEARSGGLSTIAESFDEFSSALFIKDRPGRAEGVIEGESFLDF